MLIGLPAVACKSHFPMAWLIMFMVWDVTRAFGTGEYPLSNFISKLLLFSLSSVEPVLSKPLGDNQKLLNKLALYRCLLNAGTSQQVHASFGN